MFDWRWDFTFQILPRLIVATGNTLLAAGLGYAIAVGLGDAHLTLVEELDDRLDRLADVLVIAVEVAAVFPCSLDDVA